MSEDTVANLKALCDVLKDFSIFVKRLGRTSKRHKTTIKDVGYLGLHEQDSWKKLIDKLEPEKLGQIISIMMEIDELKDDMKNFMTYNSEDLEDLAVDLESVANKLKEALK